MDHAVREAPARSAFYARIDGENLAAPWNVMGALITPEPRRLRPHLWKFGAIEAYMLGAGGLIPAAEAERARLFPEDRGNA